MKRWQRVLDRRVLTGVLIAVLAVASLGLTGCFGSGETGSLTLGSAKVAPPAIGEQGVLRVGVDSSHAPFAGLSNGKTIGIDVDVAAALAEELGLRLRIVDIRDQDPSSLLKDGTIDLVMGIQGDTSSATATTAAFSETRVGPYLVDGPAVFTVGISDTTQGFDPATLAGVSIAAQEESLSAWQVSKDFGDNNLLTFATLNAAFDQLNAGAVSYAAADAIVGSFLAITYENIRCVGLLTEPKGIYLGTATDKTELANKLMDALRVLRDSGNLQIIIAKWLGPVSTKTVLSDQAIVTLAGVSTGAEGATPSDADTTTPDATTPDETTSDAEENADAGGEAAEE
jgi:polar amino acid transport system substrate-binding protein